jgi:hypothetical protein
MDPATSLVLAAVALLHESGNIRLGNMLMLQRVG